MPFQVKVVSFGDKREPNRRLSDIKHVVNGRGNGHYNIENNPNRSDADLVAQLSQVAVLCLGGVSLGDKLDGW
jgi:hypothetical protein